MKKIILTKVNHDEITIDKVKKRDKIIFKNSSNTILGIVTIYEDIHKDDCFNIIYFNSQEGDKEFESLDQLIEYYNKYQFYILEE